jgi:hypothetical protein
MSRDSTMSPWVETGTRHVTFVGTSEEGVSDWSTCGQVVYKAATGLARNRLKRFKRLKRKVAVLNVRRTEN